MEASALQQSARLPALAGRSPLLRLQGDERLVALIRRGHHGAFEALMQRYQPRLLAFCRHMLGSQEDAEDVLQEVFAAAFNAICADHRPINARPWLYRIARNRCLNHLRRTQPAGQDSMDVFQGDGGTTTAETVHRREEFRQIVSDVHELPETQRTALLLREIDTLSYEQIAETMDTTVPSVKSLLVRARVSLAEAAEARMLTCKEVRLELGQVAEGLAKSSPPVRRHVRSCDRCRTFRGELRRTSRALAAIYPLGPVVALKKLVAAKLGLGGGGAGAAGSGAAGLAGGAVASGGAGIAGGAATTASSVAGSVISAGVGTVATKAAAGVAAAVIVTAGAVEVRQVTTARPAARERAVPTLGPPRTAKPSAPAQAPERPHPRLRSREKPEGEPKARTAPLPTPAPAQTTPTPRPVHSTAHSASSGSEPGVVQEAGSTVTLPGAAGPAPTTPPPDGAAQPPPDPSSTTPAPPPGPAPPKEPAPTTPDK